MPTTPTQVQLRRGNGAANAAFTGAQGEVTVNTDTHQLVVHDGVTVGGFTVASSGSVTAGNYSGNPPPFTPDGSAAITTDTSTGRQWSWWSGAWH